MKKVISILAIAAVAALAFVSCNKEDNVKGTWTLDCDVLDDTDLTEKQMDKLEDFIYDMIEDIVYEDITLKEAVENVKAMIQKDGPAIAAKYPDNYFTVQFGIVNENDEWVKYVTAKCKNGKLIN